MVLKNDFLIDNVSLFKDLCSTEIREIKKRLLIKRFKKNEVILREGELCQNIFIVKSGRIKIYRVSKDGKEQILDILEPGDHCACHPATPNWCCGGFAEVMIESVVWILSRRHFSEILNQNPQIALKLSKILGMRLKNYASMIENISLEDVKQRLIRFLVKQAHQKGIKTSNGIFFNLPMTRSELASFIGSARETTIRNLYDLQKKGFISIHNNYITIHKVKELELILRSP